MTSTGPKAGLLLARVPTYDGSGTRAQHWHSSEEHSRNTSLGSSASRSRRRLLQLRNSTPFISLSILLGYWGTDSHARVAIHLPGMSAALSLGRRGLERGISAGVACGVPGVSTSTT